MDVRIIDDDRRKREPQEFFVGKVVGKVKYSSCALSVFTVSARRGKSCLFYPDSFTVMNVRNRT